jgi:hypothetical protein
MQMRPRLGWDASADPGGEMRQYVWTFDTRLASASCDPPEP